MKAKLESMKADFYNVFVMGDANNRQMGRVFVLLTLPALMLIFAMGMK